MEPEIGPCLKRRFLVEIIVFRCHVRFSRCICMMGVDRKWSNKAGYSPKWLNGLVACEDNHSNKDSQIQALVQVLVLQVHILTGEILQGILEWQQHWKSRATWLYWIILLFSRTGLCKCCQGLAGIRKLFWNTFAKSLWIEWHYGINTVWRHAHHVHRTFVLRTS